MKKLFQIPNYAKALADEDTIYLYNMGKVGSNGIQHGADNILNVHSFYNHQPCPPHFKALRYTSISPLDILIKQKIKRTLVKSRSTVKLVTLVREPLKRNISEFFHHLSFWMTEATRNGKTKSTAEGMEILFELFERHFPHDYPLEWFDKEFKRFTGIDIYQQDFDKDSGIHFISKGQFEVMLVTLESINSNWSEIQHFLGKDDPLPPTKNIGANKWYGDVYSNFKSDYQPSDSLLRKLYESKYYHHFYHPRT